MKAAHINVPRIASIEAIAWGIPGFAAIPLYPGVIAFTILKYM
jgi:hypothetical protein